MLDNDQLYADSCFPCEWWRICGVKLKPFSLGHALILQSIDSPFLGFETPEFDDFMLALWVCSRPVKIGTNTTTLSLPWSWRIAAKLLRRIAKKNPVRLWNSIIALQEYVFESLWFKPPIAIRNNPLCRTSSCPSLIPMKRSLLSCWGYSEEEALNMPLKQAKIEHCAWMEHEGALKFITKSDRDALEATKKPENIAWAIRVREESARRMAERHQKAA